MLIKHYVELSIISLLEKRRDEKKNREEEGERERGRRVKE